ncbi:hypothetical protein TNCV_2264821 [Trichonephila clavipes]|nr:hypothetical protein TNCV_2264821 [Trichonephila clavipes]
MRRCRRAGPEAKRAGKNQNKSVFCIGATRKRISHRNFSKSRFIENNLAARIWQFVFPSFLPPSRYSLKYPALQRAR